MLTGSMAHRKTVVVASVLVVLSIVPLFAFVGKTFCRMTTLRSTT
jgi:hypothetical protein